MDKLFLEKIKNYNLDKATIEYLKKLPIENFDKFDYTNTKYIKSRFNIKIKCKVCGDNFEQIANNHLSKKHGCANCNGNKKMTFEKFIEKVNHQKYEYFEENFNYKNVKIKCKKCGDVFHQLGSDHINGNRGCAKCAKNKKYTQEEIVKLFIEVHNNRYTYGIYKNFNSKIEITCKEHGIFYQRCDHHLHGKNCPKCIMSCDEQVIYDYLTKNNIEFVFQKTYDNCRGKSKLLPFDFYIPSINTLIEFDGRYHFIDIYGSLEERKRLDKIKTDYCLANNIKLYRITYLDNIIEKLELILNIKF